MNTDNFGKPTVTQDWQSQPQGIYNGNYQQNLSSSMAGMSVNSSKYNQVTTGLPNEAGDKAYSVQHPTNPQNGVNFNPASINNNPMLNNNMNSRIVNGPQIQQQQLGAPIQPPSGANLRAMPLPAHQPPLPNISFSSTASAQKAHLPIQTAQGIQTADTNNINNAPNIAPYMGQLPQQQNQQFPAPPQGQVGVPSYSANINPLQNQMHPAVTNQQINYAGGIIPPPSASQIISPQMPTNGQQTFQQQGLSTQTGSPLPPQTPFNTQQGQIHNAPILRSKLQQMVVPQNQVQGPPPIVSQTSRMPPQPGQMNAMPPFQSGAMQGVPPQPGYGTFNQQPGMYNQMPAQYPEQATAQRRLDPDSMPNPIQVMLENQNMCGGLFVTNQPGMLPPLVTTKFVTQDQGNSSPRFLRSSLYYAPSTADMLKNTAVPFTLVISPFAKILSNEIIPPIVDFGELGPIRCNRCKAYMSPNMQFIDAGRRFMCLLCKAPTDVPQEYFQHLDHTGQRVDKYERPELVLGTYEFVATKDYCRVNVTPNVPAFIFVIDVSYNNIKSGLVNLLCNEIKRIIKHFPIDQGQEQSKMKVGFITYNNTVHFYNIKSTLAQPQMMVVGDVQEMFMPLLDGFLCDPDESSTVIDALMEQIPKMFADTRETETILLPAIQAGLEALKASNCAGKLLVFNSSLPIGEAPGKLKNRDDRKLLGTEKEKAILSPQCMSYNNLGQDCVQAGCSVDLFIFNNSYIDIATIGQVCRLTGGEVYKYTYFQADVDGQRLISDIIRNVARPIAFDAVMRVRTSTGVRPTDFYGHFYMSNTTDMEIASIDCDKSIAVEIKHDDKLPPEENVYIQVALLYTSCSGQRRLRILNLALKTTNQMQDVFKSCELNVVILFLAKQAMFKLLELTPKQVKDNLIQRSVQLLACYRKNCTSPTSAGQLILPEWLKLLPLYVSCLIKNDAFSGGSDMTCDDRSYVIQFVVSMNLSTSVSFFYPRLIPIHNVDVNETDIPLPIRCTHEKMRDDGAYILTNGIHLFIWLGLRLPPEFIQSVFGVQRIQQVDTDKLIMPIFDTPESRRIRGIIDGIQNEQTRHMRITLVRQHDKLENVLRHFLIEDRGTDGSASYVDFICYMHQEIKELLS